MVEALLKEVGAKDGVLAAMGSLALSVLKRLEHSQAITRYSCLCSASFASLDYFNTGNRSSSTLSVLGILGLLAPAMWTIGTFKL